MNDNESDRLKGYLADAIGAMVNAVIALGQAGDKKSADKLEKEIDKLKRGLWE